MSNILVLTADIPFFPGKNGHDYFNLRHLAKTHHVAVVGPRHAWFPEEGVENLKKSVGEVYFWPEPVRPAASAPIEPFHGFLQDWTVRLPVWLRRFACNRLLGLAGKPKASAGNLAMVSNCAPYLLRAFAERRWQAIILIQTSLVPALDYLPTSAARVVYFHDVRSDYLPRNPRIAPPRQELRAIRDEEQRAAQECDAAGFVSELDLTRAVSGLAIRCQVGVAPIPVDTGYFTPAGPDWRKPDQPIILFTGHLSHPPNIDAVLWFLQEVWPEVLARVPDAMFLVAGLIPDEKLRDACAATPRCELHGNVPDIRPFFWNATIYVVPMRFGGGVRQKILEAWSMGVPVACTTMAAEGIPAKSEENCLLADDALELAGNMIKLLGQPDLRESITRGASAVVREINSIEAAAPRFQELVERAVRIKKSRPFRLLFDLRWMEIGRAGGTEQMSFELIDAIARADHRNEFRIYCPRQTQSEWSFPPEFRRRFFDADKLSVRVGSLKAAVGNQLATQLGESGFMNSAMQTLGFYRKLDFDLVHSLCCYIHPDLVPFPNILTMLDIQHVWYPGNFSPSNWQERDRLYRESCAAAAHITTISEFTRRDVHEKYGVPLEKMTTVWIVPSRLAWETPAIGVTTRMLRRLGIKGRYLFFPGHCWPHKNHVGLIEAIDLIRDDLPRDIQIIFTGSPMPDDHPAAVMIRERKLEDRIQHLGYRSQREIRVLFHGAHALVFPSFFEGFGMPVAEAIIAGIPVACSNVTSLPEIGGDAVAYFDPKDPRQIATRLLELCTNEPLRASLIRACQQRRVLFSARRIAVKTLAIYQRVFDEVFR